MLRCLNAAIVILSPLEAPDCIVYHRLIESLTCLYDLDAISSSCFPHANLNLISTWMCADRLNQRFVHLSESCIPLYPPALIYMQLLHEQKSRVHVDDPDRQESFRVPE